MIELRWAVLPGTNTERPRLQYRVHVPAIDASGALCPGNWTEWKDVPTVVVPKEPK
jgi:hypothetical protein